MAIQIRCPKCEKAYKLADDKRGKSVRCPNCSHVFAAKPPADAAEAGPAPAPKAAAKKPAPAPQEGARAAQKTAVKKTAPVPKPAVRKKAADADRPAAPRSNKTLLLVGGLAAGALVLLLGGGIVVVVVALHFLQPQNKPVAANPVAAASSADPGTGAPPTAGGNDPAKPPDKTQPPAPNPAADWDAFAKVDRGMSQDQVVALLGQPASAENVDPATYTGIDKRLNYNPESNLKFVVWMFQGKVVKKTNSGNRPNHYPSGDVAENPPPDGRHPTDRPIIDRPPPQTPNITQEVFNQIDRGMSQDQVVALAGQPTTVIKVDPKNFPGQDTKLSYNDFVRNVWFNVVLFQDKVITKDNGQKWPVVYPGGGAPPAPAKPAGALTQAAFDKVDKGMSQDDVIALLGQPKVSVQQDPARFGGVDAELTFTNFGGGAPPAGATVDFFKGKVIKKTSPQWPAVYPSDKGK